MTNEYPKGAEWRKWDLHFHTPSSYDYKDKSVTNKTIIDQLLKKNISLVAVTDHHIIDVTRIKELQYLGKLKNISVLPGIEFLSDTRGDDPVHFIGIFPEYCKLDYVWGQIKNKTDIKKVDGEGKKPNEVYCNLLDTAKLIKELGGIVTIHAGSKSNTIENVTHAIPHSAAQKEDISKTIDIFELGDEKDVIDYKTKVTQFLKKKFNLHHPLILCSDNHNCNEYKLKQNCWIKADPTFEGLKQVLNEPEDRVYIGERPEVLDKVEKNRTKYIKELSVNQVEDYDETQGIWFKKIKIPLNSELVAIIGNKGSGKSAIADIISLCSNFHDDNDFSFLKSVKFREKKGKTAKNFKASLTWEDGKSYTKNLFDDVQDTEIISVKYIPQGQFERLTNEIDTAEKFQTEIENVVFSHMPEAERHDAKSFKELIEKTTSSVHSSLKSLKSEIEEINRQIIVLEKKTTPSYKTELENLRKKKQDELEALIEPNPITNPNEDHEKKQKNDAVNNKILIINSDISEIETQIEEKNAVKKSLISALQLLKDVKEEIAQKEIELKKFIEEKKIVLKGFSIDVNTLISVKIDLSKIAKIISSKEDELKTVKINLGEIDGLGTDSKSLPVMLEEKQNILKEEKSTLDVEQQQYQEYLSKLEIWNRNKKAIIGTKETPDTIEYYDCQIKYLDVNLNIDLENKYKERRELVKKIFDDKQKVVSVYKNARDRLNRIIEKNSETLKEYKIVIDASLVKKNDFNSKFLDYINKNTAGTYYSNAGGEKYLKQITDEINFDNKDDIVSLLDTLVNSLKFDKRENERDSQREVSKQVKDHEGLYDYLFTLQFLDSNYQLKQGNKELQQLSPGERGALLLVFYLLLDNETIPLIIDQPEDNLDNHSVATVLVPFIRAAKKKRQIIIVTHNPNLAVVADAEQVIYVKLEKEKNYTFSTISGSIENKEVNQKIVEVLEGAMPAFNMRRDKYYD